MSAASSLSSSARADASDPRSAREKFVGVRVPLIVGTARGRSPFVNSRARDPGRIQACGTNHTHQKVLMMLKLVCL